MLKTCNRNFGRAPRKLSLFDQLTYLRITKPFWLRADRKDRLHILFNNYMSLFKNGVVVWGQIVQANALMFEDGSDDCPGEIVFSLNNSTANTVEDLMELASKLYNIKGAVSDEEEVQYISAYLKNEMVRVYGLAIPNSLSPTNKCYISTTYFVRKHLPKRKIYSNWLPILVNPHDPKIILPLPERYWSPKLIKMWLDNS